MNKDLRIYFILPLSFVLVVFAVNVDSINANDDVKPIPPFKYRQDLGDILQSEGLTSGVELGVAKGKFADEILTRWTGAKHYVLVDLWAQQQNYVDAANKNDAIQAEYRQEAKERMNKFTTVNVETCENFTTECANKYKHYQFDFIYVDARHDYNGVFQDLTQWWPLLKPGGIMAGHDYVMNNDGPQQSHQNWAINSDGTVDPTGRVVKGAVDDFFDQVKLQLTISYREGGWNTWAVRKPKNFVGMKNNKSRTYNVDNRPNWKQTIDAPSFCEKLLKTPKLSPGVKGCARNAITGKCRDTEESIRFVSQFQQDYYLYVNHFSKLQGKRRGTYIDLAANDPIAISNTYIMDTCLGWNGLCIEANAQYHDPIRMYRSCRLIPTCVSDDENEQIEFFMDGPVSGIMSTNKRAQTWKKHPSARRGGHSVLMTCQTMNKIMNQNGFVHVDYLSLDVEGHELKVLKSFDWSQVQIDVITVEMNDQFQELQQFLFDKQYNRHNVSSAQMKKLTDDPKYTNSDTGALFTDAIFLHKSVTFGSPI